MGLDTSHGCWHGPYSAFMRYREKLVRLAWGRHDFDGPDPGNIWNYPGFYVGPDEPMEEWERAGQGESQGPLDYPDGDPLVTLISHSDCDGDIPPWAAAPLADRLEEVLRAMPERALYDELRPATERWISGLRAAAQSGEPVTFR